MKTDSDKQQNRVKYYILWYKKREVFAKVRIPLIELIKHFNTNFFATQPDDLSSNTRIHMLEWEH